MVWRYPLGLLALLVVLAGCGGLSHSGAPATPPGYRPRPPQVQAAGPIGLAVVDGAVWSMNSGDGTVSRIDPDRLTVTTSVRVGKVPLRGAADGSTLWVSLFGDGAVVAVDTRTGKVVHRAQVGAGAEGITVGLGKVWVVSRDAQRLTWLSRSGRVLGKAALGGQPRQVAIVDNRVYVSDYANGTVAVFDSSGRFLRTSGRLCRGAQSMVADGDDLLLACTSDSKVVKVRTVDLSVISWHGGNEPDALAVTRDIWWVVDDFGPSLTFYRDGDPPMLELGVTVLANNGELHDQANVDVAQLGDQIYVSSTRDGGVFVVDKNQVMPKILPSPSRS